MSFTRKKLFGIDLSTIVQSIQSSLMPRYAIMWFFGNTAPSGWVVCNGYYYSEDGSQSSTTKTTTCTIKTPNMIGVYPLGATSSIGTRLKSGLPKATVTNVSGITGGGWEGNRGGHYLAVKADSSKTPSVSFADTDETTFVRPPSINLLPCMKL